MHIDTFKSSDRKVTNINFYWTGSRAVFSVTNTATSYRYTHTPYHQAKRRYARWCHQARLNSLSALQMSKFYMPRKWLFSCKLCTSHTEDRFQPSMQVRVRWLECLPTGLFLTGSLEVIHGRWGAGGRLGRTSEKHNNNSHRNTATTTNTIYSGIEKGRQGNTVYPGSGSIVGV